ncbi:serine hydrolase domain-containing protein [Phenylobacterium sp.]|uniref:serine hydrolase domain-containing protein n=1 Tax=Phenylobacterium sp. TaxID=1871053 RepID=UPI002FC6966B
MKLAIILLVTTALVAGSPAISAAAPQPKLPVAQYATPDGPGLAVASFGPDGKVRSAAAGLADVEVGAPFRTDTPIHAASVTKQFTGAAIILLVDQGRLSLDDDVRKYLPWMPDYGTKITIRHLLDHRSGLRSIDAIFALQGLENSDPETRDRVMEAIKRQRGLNTDPGGDFIYGNTGYFLLGEVVAAITGESFSSWTRKNIFLPLGMKNTQILEDHAAILPGRAVGYEPGPGGLQLAEALHGFGGPSNLHTTADDLIIWCKALIERRGPAGALARRLAAVTPPVTGSVYAYGLEVSRSDGRLVWDHGGLSSGYSARVFILPEERRAAATLSNGALDFFRTQTVTRAAGMGQSLPTFAAPAGPAIDPRAAQSAEGLFRADTGVTLRVWREGSKLKTAIIGVPGEFEIVPSGDRFAVPALNATMRMDRIDGEPARVLTSEMNGQIIRADRIEAAALTGDLTRFQGRYFSCDLQTMYVVDRRGASLELSSARFSELPLTPTAENTFLATLPMAASVATLSFKLGADGKAAGLVVSTDRARNMPFSPAREGATVDCGS